LPGRQALQVAETSRRVASRMVAGPGLEFLRRQAARQQVLAQQHHGLFPLGVGDADRPFIHATTVKE
jgi:hypothetical protein